MTERHFVEVKKLTNVISNEISQCQSQYIYIYIYIYIKSNFDLRKTVLNT